MKRLCQEENAEKMQNCRQDSVATIAGLGTQRLTSFAKSTLMCPLGVPALVGTCRRGVFVEILHWILNMLPQKHIWRNELYLNNYTFIVSAVPSLTVIDPSTMRNTGPNGLSGVSSMRRSAANTRPFLSTSLVL